MPKRADNFDGSCREILSGKHAGKWRVQYTVVTETGLRKRVSKIFRTKTDGREGLRKMRHGNVTVQNKVIREPTMGEWFDWLAENDWPESIAPVTIAQRKSRFKKYARAHFENVQLSKIDAVQVRAFYKQLRKEGASENIVVMVKSDLVRAFNQAIVPYQRVSASLANPFRLPVPMPKPREAVVLTPQQINKALRVRALDERERALLGTFLLAGIRLGEAMALDTSHILFGEELITLNRAVRIEYGGKQNIGLPKGDKIRNAVLCLRLKQLLETHIATLPGDSLLWAAGNGKPLMKKRFYELWKSIVKKAELPPELSPHDCRLSHINIVEKLCPDVSATTLKEHVGHASSGVTESNYTRATKLSQEVLRNSLDTLFPPLG